MVTAVGVLDSEGDQQRCANIWPWAVVLSASLFFFYVFVQLNMFNAIDPALLKEFSFSAAQLGQLSANYFYANMIFLFPAGIALDRFSTRRLILSAMVLCVASTFAFAFTQRIWVMEVCRFLTGAGGAFAFLGAVKLASHWFPAKRMALVTGVIVTVGMIGGMVAQAPLTYLTDAYGWRMALSLTACLGVIILVAIAIVARDYPPNVEGRGPHHSAASHGLGFWEALRGVCGNLQNWLGGLYTCMINLPIFLLGAMWGSLYLVQIHHLTRASASIVVSMLFVGTIVGSPLLGWFSDRIGLRRLPMIGCAVVSIGIVLAIMYIPGLGLSSLLFLFLGLGFFTSAQVIGYPLVSESNPRALTGTSVGLAAVLVMSGGMAQPLFGWLMGLRWQHIIVNKIPIYSVSDFRLAMMIIPIAFVVGVIVALIARETYCKAQD